MRKLDTNPVHERDQFKFGRYERVKIPMKDGFVLEGAITYPPDFDPTKKYPVWLFTYAGPHAPTVRDELGRRPRRSTRRSRPAASSSSASIRGAPAARGRSPRGRATSNSACRSSRTSKRRSRGWQEPVRGRDARRHQRPQLRRVHGGFRPDALQDVLRRASPRPGHRLAALRLDLHRAVHAARRRRTRTGYDEDVGA